MKKLALLLLLLAPAGAQAQTFGPVPQVSTTTNIPTYAAGDANIANTGAGDILCISGSSTKTIFISEIHTTATATAAITINVSVIKRSSAASGGTPVSETVVPLDSNNAAGTATVTGYTVSPTPGTAVGTVEAHKLAIGVQGNTASFSEADMLWGNMSNQALVLRGTSQFACVNVTAAGAGASFAVHVEWTEQ